MSKSPLQEYFELLSMFSTGMVKLVDDSLDIDLEKVESLITQNCLSGRVSSSLDGKSFLNVSITPQSAVVLAEWSSLLRATSPKGQIMDALGKVIWLLAGMLITVGSGLLLKIIE